MDYSQFLNMHDELSLLAVIVILFLADLFICGDRKSGVPAKSLSVLPVVLIAIQTVYVLLAPKTGTTTFGGMYQLTPMMSIVKGILNVGTLIVFLMAHEWMKRPENKIKQGEFYLLTLCTLLGMYFMISAGHFLMFFIGLELASVPMTALVAYTKKNQESAEASAKYILTALFSSALLLYGISLLYGTCGTLYFDDMAVHLDTSNLVQLMALVFFISGLGFKISLVPFHLWTADTYQGAPTPVTAYLSVISKGSAAFVLFIVLIKVFAPFIDNWNQIFFWIIIISITLANIFAIRQNNMKRFMAFSAISQAGYVVMGVMGGTAEGMTAIVYYIFVYLVANLGIFVIMNIIEQRSGKINISDYDALYDTNPKLAFIMTLCLFSLAGIPPFAGFFSKFFMFMAAFKAGFHLLVFIALVNTVISLYYYLLIVKAMYIKKNDSPVLSFRSDAYTRIGLVLCTIGVVFAGILSGVYQYLDTFAYGLLP
ncbi:MAG: NADH-quinone oxidoreductase subunit N [Bacteroidaceae bacterium]|nr:NADH-quinone oxidoreductase subunit N [Bacteroidaceae bacterium]